MSLRRWQAEGRLRAYTLTKGEVHDLLALAERDMQDASLEELSIDRRFMIAYNAALTLATIPLRCAGYQTHGKGHHWLTFRLLPETMGEDVQELADYFDQCRTKRNIGTYDRSGQISKNEVKELIAEVRLFRDGVVLWLKTDYPKWIE